MAATSGEPRGSLNSTPGPRADADRALQLAQLNPGEADTLGKDVFDRAMRAGDQEAAAIAARALGLAARERHDFAQSVAWFRRAARVADRNGLSVLAGHARLSLAGTLALRGQWTQALKETDLAAQVLTGVELARLETQRAMILRAHGRLEEAIEGFGRALPVLRRHRDRLWEARLCGHRGLAKHYLGDVAGAEADLRRADELFQALGQHRVAAITRQNLGMVVGLRGDIPAALAFFEEADRYLAERGEVDAMSLSDRCVVLTAARLVVDARRSAELAVETLATEGRLAYLAVAQLQLAGVALLAGDHTEAEAIAGEAREAFTRQRRPTWSALARLLGVRAAWERGERSASLLVSARRAADALDRGGFTIAALDARILVAQLAISQGRMTVARRQLRLASAAKRVPLVQVRTRAWYADALVRLQAGDRRGAWAALRAGMDLVDRYRATLGATELRAHASGHAEDLARLGLRMAVQTGRAASVLTWAERFRAGTLQLRPVRPPDDARLAGALAELRAVVVQVENATLAGRPTRPLESRQADLEEVVKEQTRHATGFLAASLYHPPSVSDLSSALGPRALVELVESEGELHAVVVAGGRARFRHLAPLKVIEAEMESLGFCLRRLLHGRGGASRAAASDAATYAAQRLDELLLAPVASDIGERPLVLVPTGPLHAVPWPWLPSCAARPMTVAPSAAAWHRASIARHTQSRHGGVALVAGPGLVHAGREVADLARRFYPDAVRLTGRRASAKAVCGAFGRARLAHVAAHGRFRPDNPLFSSLELVDGPLTVYDLEALPQTPATMVLSACDSGVSAVELGDELMGLTAALVALTTRAVIASVFPVPDDATRRFMVRFHRALNRGVAPALALAEARAPARTKNVPGEETEAEQRDRITASAFVCFGAGV